jgi:hypothetical protein
MNKRAIIALGVVAFVGVGFWFTRSNPLFGGITPLTDQDIYDTILAAEKNGEIPSFTIDDTTDLSRISAQYIQVAKDSGVDVSAVQLTDEKNLYLASRTALVEKGELVAPLTPEAAAATGQPVEEQPIP